MPTLLILDPDHARRAALQRALGATWSILEADNGLPGLDLARQHQAHLGVVLLNLHTSDLGGLLVCALLRMLSSTLPIIPLTSATTALPLLHELACAPPMVLPTLPAQIATHVQRVLHEPPSTFVSSAALQFLQVHAAEMEQQVRQERTGLRVIVFASSLIRRGGIERLISGVGYIHEAGREAELVQLLAGKRASVIVADAADGRVASKVAQRFQVPLVLVARSSISAQMREAPQVHTVVRETDPHAEAQLYSALEVFASRREMNFPNEPQFGARTEPPMPPAVEHALVAAGITPRLQRALWLSYHEWSDDDIARAMTVMPETPETYRKRVQRKVGLTKDELPAWVQRIIEDGGDDDPPQERSVGS